MQIWKSANIVIWKYYVEGFTLKHRLLLSDAHVRYVKNLFTNIHKQENILKIGLIFKRFINIMGK